jgi:hypothetical protein
MLGIRLCLGCGTSLEMTLVGKKKNHVLNVDAYRRKREYFD